ncbi:MAG: hypothetical protein JWM86_908 [Thermoleophilia bacterium]|nr:hypothetical protein [Thermoleophilia bacterium]
MPNWTLAIPVALALAGAGWLFIAPLVRDDPAATRAKDTGSQTDDGEGEGGGVDGVLELGDDPATTTATEDAEAEEAGPEGATTVTELPALLEALKDVDVVLVPASARGPEGRARIAGVRVNCSGAGDTARLAVEQQEITALAALLTRAGANVQRLGDAGTVECLDRRTAVQEAADVTIVLRGPAPAPPVAAGDEPARLPRAAVQAGRALPAGRVAGPTATLVDELAATLRAATPTASKRRDALLVSAGAIDRPGGGSTVLVELPQLADATSTEAAALAIARGIAGLAVRER